MELQYEEKYETLYDLKWDVPKTFFEYPNQMQATSKLFKIGVNLDNYHEYKIIHKISGTIFDPKKTHFYPINNSGRELRMDFKEILKQLEEKDKKYKQLTNKLSTHAEKLILLKTIFFRIEENVIFLIFDPIDLENPLVKLPPENRNLQNTRTTKFFKRNLKIAKELKCTYDYKCQICGIKIKKTNNEFIIEAAHIRPLFHDGKDSKGNMLILCPNHHKEFDFGSITINPDYNIKHFEKNLNIYHGKTVEAKHKINQENLEFHSKKIFENRFIELLESEKIFQKYHDKYV